ncbi:hypothetical protein VTH82DRAFT_5552 [Thermothelomyces myriococcoides]
MSSPNRDETKPANPETPGRTPTAKHTDAATPANKRASAQATATPKSAPAAPGRSSSHKKKPEPSLLSDFLLGRPSPARVAAQREAIKQRRKSMAADAANVREELRREMRAAAVRRLQQPGGVRDRVKAWQKASAAAMAQEGGGIPHAEDAATEPTEVAVHLPPESVTEEDRVRIKMRQKPKKKAKPDQAEVKENRNGGNVGNGGDGDETKKEKPAAAATTPSKPPVVKSAPKKRIVSDDNWMKAKKGRSPPQNGPAGTKQQPAPASGLPKDFLQRTAQNPSVQSKIRDWVQRVEVPEPPPAKVKVYRHKKTGATVTVEEDAQSVVSSEPGTKASPKPPPADDGIRVKPMKPEKPNPDTGDGGIRVTPVRKKEKEPLDDGIRVRPTETKTPDDDGIRVQPSETKILDDDGIRVQPSETNIPDDDGIRVQPSETNIPDDDGIRVHPSEVNISDDNGIRVRPAETKTPDDGIRVRAAETESQDDGIRVQSSETKTPGDGIRVRPIECPPPDDGTEDGSNVREPVDEPTVRPSSPQQRPVKNVRSASPGRARRPDSHNATGAERGAQTEPETPTKRKVSKRHSKRKGHGQGPNPAARSVKPPEIRSLDSDTERPIPPHVGSDDESEIIPPTVLGNKSLAEIPFGYSAFSVLDLPLGADARNSTTRRPKAQRNPSLKTVPKVFKKVVTGAKDIIQEMAEPPKPVVANKPQSIESWLNDTVDPFVETVTSSPTQGPALAEARERLSRSSKPSLSPSPAPAPATTDPKRDDSEPPRKRVQDSRPRETRETGGPRETREARETKERREPKEAKEMREVREAKEKKEVKETKEKKEAREMKEKRDAREMEKRETKEAKEARETRTLRESREARERNLSSQEPQRRRPPTNGAHELSTIISAESGTVISEAHSDVSQTTITQTTAFTKTTDIPRQKSQKQGLKRRLTKHSDLVSVLSLPDNGQSVASRRSMSVRSSRSLHRRPNRANKSKADELLDEFADDEHFYGRELKALVDGVIPVLLRDIMNGDAQETISDATAKSVINMGMALEKLRDFHRRVPLTDIPRLLSWMGQVSPAYDHYLDVWRLGFQGLIINLAPRHGKFDDDDSLLNALPRNEDGDVIGEDGERVDVAFLLKRPLIRVKWMVKFLRAAVAVTESHEAERLLIVFTGLQEKARKRHREETARMMDEDANNTDTSRCRDLRNLLPLEGVLINPVRQVAALDVFSLDLNHSNGQRLGCQVELIFRDRPSVPSDKGDILIRELGDGTRSWLLFPPVPRQYISARRGDDDGTLIAMIRGTHNGIEWFELLKLSTDCEEQIDYWLRVMGSNPLPPTTRTRPSSMVLGSATPRLVVDDVPVGERNLSVSTWGPSEREGLKTSSEHHTHSPGQSPSPPRALPRRDRTSSGPEEEKRRSFSWEQHPEDVPKIVRPPPNSTPFREDGAPPPPIHRTLGPKSPGMLAPPVDSGPHGRLRRRMSSPLKHEYHPSDISSETSSTVSDDESESSQSSSDELEEDEVPDTIPGYSIKEAVAAPEDSDASDNSITPSHSASQVRAGDDTEPEKPVPKFVATVSYWSSRRGVWKDINNGQPASVIVHPGYMEVHHTAEKHLDRQAHPLQSSGTPETDDRDKDVGSTAPLIVLVLTPVVMIRRSTALDLEVRSPASSESRLKIQASMFRFRTTDQGQAKDLYEAVHYSRMNNARYIQLSEEARVRSFGQMQSSFGTGSADGDSSGRGRGLLGRRNSYRASTRAPSVSQGSVSTTISAASFLRRLMGGGNNNSYDIDESTLDRQRPSSAPVPGGGSLYTSSSGSGSGSGSGSITPPRSGSISLSNSGSHSRWSTGFAKQFSPDQPLEIRCHLNVQNNRWLDKGDCILHISRPPPGVRQELSLYHGLEKRIIVTHATKKNADRPLILLDAVLGSKCFSMLGSKGIMCSVWENLRDEEGNVGVAPRSGAIAGKVTKWCFQCKTGQQAAWIMQLLTTEVPGLMMG